MTKNISDYLKTPEKYIPFGMYCCHNDTVCPFWDSKPGQYPQHEDGYCHFLGKSDWDINEESKKRIVIAHHPTNKALEGKCVDDLYPETIDPISGKKQHFGVSLLWDQCKECNVNTADPEDVKYVQTEIEIPQNVLQKLKKGTTK